MCNLLHEEDLQMSLQALTVRATYVKIILSEITLRRDGRNSQVTFCNKQLRKFASSTEISLARHSNLNSEEFFDDAKHLCEEKIGSFALNIKTRFAMLLVMENPNLDVHSITKVQAITKV